MRKTHLIIPLFVVVLISFIPFQLMAKNVYPQALKWGDTIALIAPAKFVTNQQRDLAISYFRDTFGLNAEAINVDESNEWGDYFSDDDEARAKAINEAFRNQKYKAIIALRGGWGSARILDKIDYDVIKRNPKIFVGFSDITSLLLSIYYKTGLVTFHGPLGIFKQTPITKWYFENILFNGGTPVFNNKLGYPLETIYPQPEGQGSITGTLVGGNLTVLATMMQSDYFPPKHWWKDKILIIEDVAEANYSIDRMLNELRLAGVLNNVRAVIFGTCNSCKKYNFFSLEQLFKNVLKRQNSNPIPSFWGAMFGHNYYAQIRGSIIPFSTLLKKDIVKFDIDKTLKFNSDDLEADYQWLLLDSFTLPIGGKVSISISKTKQYWKLDNPVVQLSVLD